LSYYAWTAWKKNDRPRVVGDKKPNRWGLFDIVGNAHEYCLDAADYKEGVITTNTYRDKITDPLCRSGKYRISRGGSWISGSDDSRSAYRDCSKVNFHSAISGFRVVLAIRMSQRVPKE
jgi:formylglycine-generating enzyme required for sulfatase activity